MTTARQDTTPAVETARAVAVRFEHVTKRFPGVQALSDVSLDVAQGSCHALCGENGAGKSTLGKILAGIYTPDEGRLFVHGRAVNFDSPRDALAAGVGIVHQELVFCGNLSVAENLCLGTLPSRRGFVDRPAMEARARALLAEIGATMDVHRPVADLSIAQRQIVQIASAVGSGARVIVFDEPTSSLSQVDAERLYDLIRRLRERGVTCIYVSHRMPEVFRLCDTVSVLRDGKHVGTHPASELSEGDIVRMMIGRPLAEYFPPPKSTEEGREVLRVQDLTSPGKFQHVSFSLRSREIVGLAGLVGAGRSEIASAIFGLDPDARGEIVLNGEPARIDDPADAIRLGIGLVPEDRKKQGLVLSESCRHNTTLPILERLARLTWVRESAEWQLVREYFKRLGVRARDPDVPAAGLSGGNQQKVVLARWLAANSKVLILDEPTRGVDVGAKAEIHALINELAAQGTAVVLISSELPELLSLSTRILVLREGRLVGEVPGHTATQDGLLRLMAGLAA
ncbi:MAG TPA: sugar ABC transporter ATP-binding protein [Gemmatimonadaceae bacterium]|jgi:ribose transport system ATP-binding protein|nr:sugar ABC transporter ATP-binding protein [Gemmatimonadaceae bacterium]